MKVKVRIAPAGAQSFWREIDDTLHVWVSEDLDDLARQRYVQKAKVEHGITEERRRRRIIPQLPIRYGDTASASQAAAAVAVGGGVLAVGVAAAVVLPVALDGSQSHAHHPRAAASARPSAPQTPSQKAPADPAGPPDKTPTRPDRSTEPPPSHGVLPGVPALQVPSLPRHPVGHTVPVDDTGSAPTPPRLPKPPAPPSIPPTRARPLLRVDLPPVVRASVKVSPRLQIRVHIGAGQRP